MGVVWMGRSENFVAMNLFSRKFVRRTCKKLRGKTIFLLCLSTFALAKLGDLANLEPIQPCMCYDNRFMCKLILLSCPIDLLSSSVESSRAEFMLSCREASGTWYGCQRKEIPSLLFHFLFSCVQIPSFLFLWSGGRSSLLWSAKCPWKTHAFQWRKIADFHSEFNQIKTNIESCSFISKCVFAVSYHLLYVQYHIIVIAWTSENQKGRIKGSNFKLDSSFSLN